MHWIVIYPLYSVIQPLHKRSLVIIYRVGGGRALRTAVVPGSIGISQNLVVLLK